MAERVKRHYASALRAEQARATRRTVVGAAHELFVRQGWTATSIEQVAAAAGVSRATVFTVGGKPELLKLAYDTAIGGDDEDIAMADRPAVRELAAAPDRDALVARYVELVLAADVRVAGIYVALRAAADADERVRALFGDVEAQRLTGATGFVAPLAARGWLRPGLEPEVAADVLWTLLDPGLYAALVLDRAWPPERFAAWWERTLRMQLLAG
jgi:TetR/AcrR family transcriptional regulator, regulator of autoinduction and epiphytic fitness